MPRSLVFKVLILLGVSFLLLLVLAALNAFNLPFLRPRGSSQIFLFTALSVIAFLLLLTLLVLLFRNIVKLLADQRSRVLGSRIRSRMLVGALLLSFAPAVFMFLFSFGLLNRSMERWFSQPASQLRQDSTRISLELSQYAAANARAEARRSSVGADPLRRAYSPSCGVRMLGALRETFMGLAGLGDLVLTCTDDQSRNRRFGMALGRGASPTSAQSAIHQVIEKEPNPEEIHQVAARLASVGWPLDAGVR